MIPRKVRSSGTRTPRASALLVALPFALSASAFASDVAAQGKGPPRSRALEPGVAQVEPAPLGDESIPPWVDVGDVPIPAWVRSVAPNKLDAALAHFAIDPTGLKLMNLYPLPNYQDPNNRYNYANASLLDTTVRKITLPHGRDAVPQRPAASTRLPRRSCPPCTRSGRRS